MLGSRFIHVPAEGLPPPFCARDVEMLCGLWDPDQFKLEGFEVYKPRRR